MNGISTKTFPAFLKILLPLLLAVSSSAVAQITQTGIITGTVADSDGMPLLLAYITVSSPALMGRIVTTQTGLEGEFRIPGLPPGIYRIEVVLEGFRTGVAKNLQLGVGDVIAVDIVLAGSNEEALPDIEGRAPLIDLYAKRLDASFEDVLLDKLPTKRNLKSILPLVPGISDFIGELVSRGSEPQSNTYAIDGVGFTNPLDGAPAAVVPYCTIQRLEVATGGLDAWLGQGSGAAISLYSKSAGNRRTGEAGFHYRNDLLNSNNSHHFDKPRDNAFLPYFNVGGPLKGSRAWYHFGLGINSMEEKWPAARAVPEKRTEYRFMARTALFPTSKTQFNVSFLRDHQDRLHHFAPNTAHWTIPDGNYLSIASDLFTGNNYLSYGLLFKLSDSVSLKFNGGWMDLEREIKPTVGRGAPSVVDPFGRTISGSYLGYRKQTDTRSWTLNAGMDYYMDEPAGVHQIKLGMEFESSAAESLFSFDGGKRYVVYSDPGNILFSQEFTAGQREDDSILTNVKITRFSIFAQNDWSPFPQLLLSLGVRYDGPVMDNSQLQVADWNSISPRICLSIDPLDQDKMALRFGFARYYDRPLLSQIPPAPYTITTTVNLDNLQAFESQYGRLPEGWGSSKEIVRPFGYGAELQGADPNTEAPVTRETFFTVEGELIRNVYSRFSLIRRKSSRLLAFKEPDPMEDTSGQDAGAQAGSSNRPELIWDNDFSLWRRQIGAEFSSSVKLRRDYRMELYYIWSKTEGNIGAAMAGVGPFELPMEYPSRWLMRGDYLPTDRRHSLQCVFTGSLPHGIQIGSVFRYYTGSPLFRRLFNPDPLAAQYETVQISDGENIRLDDVATLDLRLEKDFVLRGNRVDFILDVFNLLNWSAAVERFAGFDYLQDEHGLTTLDPLAYQRPRTIQLGMRFGF